MRHPREGGDPAPSRKPAARRVCCFVGFDSSATLQIPAVRSLHQSPSGLCPFRLQPAESGHELVPPPVRGMGHALFRGRVAAGAGLGDPLGGAVVDSHPHHAGGGAQLAAAGRLPAAGGPAAVSVVRSSLAVQGTRAAADPGLGCDPRGTSAARRATLVAAWQRYRQRNGAAGGTAGRLHADPRQRHRNCSTTTRLH